jgi:hypothetical protein
MSLDFAQLKAIPISEVVARFGVQLRYRGEWGSAICPLPSHKKDEKERTFSVSIKQNYWKCFSASCNESAGCKGGDTINFVALMDGTKQVSAAQKLADMFHTGQSRTAPHMEKPSKVEPKTEMQKATSDSKGSSDSVKYTEKVRVWFDTIWPRGEGESDEDYRRRLLRAITTELIQNYKAGKAGKIL